MVYGPVQLPKKQTVVRTPIYVDIGDIDNSSGTPTVSTGTPTYGSVDEYKRSGGGSSASARRKTREAEVARQAEIRRKEIERQRIATEQARQEQIRITNLKNALVRAGARKSEVVVRNAQGEIVRRKITIQGMNQKVIISENLITGKTDVKTFKSGRISGGLSSSQQSRSDVKTIEKDLKDSGLKPIKDSSGRVVGFSSPITGKKYNYNTAGIDAFNKDAKKPIQGPVRPAYGPSPHYDSTNTRTKENVKTIRSEIEKWEIEKRKLRLAGKHKEAIRLGDKINIRRGDLMVMVGVARLDDFFASLPMIAKTGKDLLKDPKNIVPISAMMWAGIKTDAKDTWKLMKYSPHEAVGKIGADVLTFKAVGGAFKAVGKVAKPVGAQLNPLFRKIPTVRIGAVTKGANLKWVGSSGIKVVDTADDIARAITKAKGATKKYLTAKRRINVAKMKPTSFGRAKNLLDTGVDILGEAKARTYLKAYYKRGGKLGLGKEEQFVKGIQQYLRKQLEKNQGYQNLKKLSAFDDGLRVDMIKKGRVQSAKIVMKRSYESIGRTPLAKAYKTVMGKVKSGKLKLTKSKPVRIVKKGVKKVKKTVVKTKAQQKKTIKEYKSNVEYTKQLKRVKVIRQKMLGAKKSGTITVGSTDYVLAVENVLEIAKRFSKIRAKKYLSTFEKKGGKLGLGKAEEFIRKVQEEYIKRFKQTPTFKRLENGARLNKIHQIKYKKLGKIQSAKILMKNNLNNLKKLPITKTLQKIIKKVKYSKPVKVVKKGIRKSSPKRIKKVIATKKAKTAYRKQYQQTFRYRMEQKRPIRSVTLEQLKRAKSVNVMRKSIDDFFDEMRRRQKLPTNELSYRQMKNLIKKKVSKALMKGDMVELNRFKLAVAKMQKQMAQKSNHPTVKVIEKVGKTKRVRTIKDFKPETPKGSYVEVKSGQQVMLQKVRTATTQATKQVQKVLIKQVIKKKISLKPLFDYGVYTVVRSAFANINKTKQILLFKPTTSSLVAVIPKQELKVLQGFEEITILKTNQDIAQLLNQAVKSKQKSVSKLKQELKPKKKKIPVKLKLTKGFSIQTLSKVVPTYHIIVKERGKLKTKQPRELTKKDARDYLAYQIDHSLARSAMVVPTGKSKQVVRVPLKMRGYYLKNSRKLRAYKIKRGKKKQLVDAYIEKRKHFQDTKTEVAQANRLRAKRRTVKRKVVKKRKPTPRKRRTVKKKVVRRKPVKRRRKR